MRPNPFHKLTREEQLDEKKALQEINARVKAVAEIGKRILRSPDGQKYQEGLEKALKEIIKILFTTPANPDPMKDAYFLRITVNQLGQLYNLLELVKSDARKK